MQLPCTHFKLSMRACSIRDPRVRQAMIESVLPRFRGKSRWNRELYDKDYYRLVELLWRQRDLFGDFIESGELMALWSGFGDDDGEWDIQVEGRDAVEGNLRVMHSGEARLQLRCNRMPKHCPP